MQLLEKGKLGSITLQNKVVMAPMTRSRAGSDHVPTPIMATYYAQRSGAGLIITEGTAPSPDGAGYARIPGIWSQEQVEAWKPVTQAAHKGGAAIFMQLMHTGRVGHPDNLPAGAKLIAPSAIAPATTQMWSDQAGATLPIPAPEAIPTDALPQVVQSFVKAAQNAIAAGFDGVELHAANGYLLEQFLSPHANQREDAYGGSAENRNRFVLEVARAVSEAIGKEKTGIRISPYGAFNDIFAFEGIDEQYRLLVEGLNQLNLAYLHMVNHASMGAPEVPEAIQAMCRHTFKGTYILSGGFDQTSAEGALSANRGDLVAFGRPFLSNPDLVERFRKGQPLAQPDFNTLYTPGEVGYTDYPNAE